MWFSWWLHYHLCSYEGGALQPAVTYIEKAPSIAGR